MRRAGSFGRRKDRRDKNAPAPEPDNDHDNASDDSEPSATAPEARHRVRRPQQAQNDGGGGGGGRIGNILRSASFSRRKNRSAKGSRGGRKEASPAEETTIAPGIITAQGGPSKDRVDPGAS